MSDTNYAQQNFTTACVTACPEQVLQFTSCYVVGGIQSGEQYFRLFLGDVEVASNDDYCGLGLALIDYVVPSGESCQDYCLHIGCDSSTACTAYVEFSAMVSGSPTMAPTPDPSAVPTYVNDFPYQTDTMSNTASATQNYETGCVWACPLQTLRFSACDSPQMQGGDQYFRLFAGTVQVAQNDNACAQSAEIIYTVPAGGACQDYCLHMGCADSDMCVAYVELSTNTPPTAQPSFTASPSLQPSAGPTVAPSAAPSGPSIPPTVVPSAAPTAVDDFPILTPTMSNTNYATQSYTTACVTACAMQSLQFTACNDTAAQVGDPYFRLFVGDTQLDESDDVCGRFPEIVYTVPEGEICQNYCLHIGCYSSSTCSAYVEFYMVQFTNTPSSRPSSRPSALPSSQPTTQPSMRPSSRPSSRPSVVVARRCYIGIN
jgi:hypothetical protein